MWGSGSLIGPAAGTGLCVEVVLRLWFPLVLFLLLPLRLGFGCDRVVAVKWSRFVDIALGSSWAGRPLFLLAFLRSVGAAWVVACGSGVVSVGGMSDVVSEEAGGGDCGCS